MHQYHGPDPIEVLHPKSETGFVSRLRKLLLGTQPSHVAALLEEIFHTPVSNSSIRRKNDRRHSGPAQVPSPLDAASCLYLNLHELANTPAEGVLTRAAFCQADDIPADLFFHSADGPATSVEKCLVKLADISLIRYDESSVTVHPLTQSVARVEIDEKRQRHGLDRLTRALVRQFKDPNDFRNWPILAAYAPHARAAVRHAERLGHIPQAAYLGNQLGLYLSNSGQFDRALDILRTAQRIACTDFGNCHPKVAACLNNIGTVLHDTGDLDGALECYRQAQRIDALTYGDYHPNLAVRANNIASALESKGDLRGALDAFRQAEQFDRSVFGDDHPKVAIRLNNIGNVLLAMGNSTKALNCFCEAKRIDAAIVGHHHPKIATRLNNMASALQAKGRGDEARRMIVEAFRIFLTTLGPQAPQTVSTAENVILLKGDPLALARQYASAETAAQLRDALMDRSPESSVVRAAC